MKLLDWCCPPSALAEIGKVNWRIVGPATPTRDAAIAKIALAFDVPPSMLPKPGHWVRWPSLDDYMQMRMRAHVKLIEQRLTAELHAAGHSELAVSFDSA